METKRRFVLFDLDGTLLPLERPRFEAALFQNLDAMFARKFPDQPDAAAAMKRASLACFHSGDTGETNEARMCRLLREEAGEPLAGAILEALEGHYRSDYNSIREIIRDPSVAREALELVNAYGGVPVVATNPVAPKSCIYARMDWAGIRPEQFRLVTTYELCHYVKPDPRYYQEVLRLLGAEPSECIMIGNDTDEDMEGAIGAGIEAYLMTDYVMDRRDSVEQYHHGTSREMLEYLKVFLTRGGSSWQEKN